MPSYILTCPICKKRYKLTLNDPSGLQKGNFTCKHCRYTAPMSSVVTSTESPQPAPQPAPRPFVGVPQPGQPLHNPTKVAPGNDTQGNAYLTVVGNNTRLVLGQGAYVVGRKSSDSTANLQIAPDICMSRQHARLAVQVIKGRLMAQIVGLKANNPVIVNGKAYAAGQPCTLKSGDKIQMGKTITIFSIS